MYKKCPECGYVRTGEEKTSADQCPACELVFSKWIKSHFAPEPELSEDVVYIARNKTRLTFKKIYNSNELAKLKKKLFVIKIGRDPISLYGYMALLIVLMVLGLRFIGAGVQQQTLEGIDARFFHSVNLVFHEAGHVIFRFFGEFIHILGGTLMQLIVPMVFAVYFTFWRKQPISSSVMLWWFGISLMDVAPYVDDARRLVLPLLGGGTGKENPGHDWNNLLRMTGCLELDHVIAWLFYLLGVAMIIVAIAWAGYILKEEYRFRLND